MRRIPIYASDWIGGIGLPRFDSWKLCRWRVGDAQPVKNSTIIAELECAIAVIEHEVFYSGTLHHKVAEGDSFLVSEPIGFISCSDEEYAVYLQSESARRICVTLEPGELREVEALKADESNEAFVARIFRAGLAQCRPNP
jgi:hypothetical protein